MLLDIKDIKKITFGAERIIENENGFNFYRFNEKEQEVYQTDMYSRFPSYYQKTLATSGIRFDFHTDAEVISFDYEAKKVTSLTDCYFDLYCDKDLYASIGFNNEENSTTGELTVKLPYGTKRVTLYFPNSFSVSVKNIQLKNASIIKPASFNKKILVYGDSITQGFSAINPSMCYVSRLAFDLDFDYINKGVGGAVFEERLSDAATDSEPQIITIAYGTNDWNATSRIRFENNCESFIKNISNKFKNSKIFIITPLWRLDYEKEKEFGKFEEVGEYIKAITETLDNVSIIEGWNILTHSESFFSDRILHPSDVGHVIMSKRILEHIRKEI